MLKELSSLQVAEWMAYYNLEPFGYTAEWYKTGVLSATIANVHRSKKAKAFAPEDFMPEPLVRKQDRQSTSEQKAILQSIVTWARKAGKLKRKK